MQKFVIELFMGKFVILILFLFHPLIALAGNAPELNVKIESIPTDYDITLIWSLHEDKQYDKVIVRRKEKGYPETVKDGILVYSGNGNKVVDKDLVAYTEYYYGFFFFDSHGRMIGWSRYKEKT